MMDVWWVRNISQNWNKRDKVITNHFPCTCNLLGFWKTSIPVRLQIPVSHVALPVIRLSRLKHFWHPQYIAHRVWLPLFMTSMHCLLRVNSLFSLLCITKLSKCSFSFFSEFRIYIYHVFKNIFAVITPRKFSFSLRIVSLYRLNTSCK